MRSILFALALAAPLSAAASTPSYVNPVASMHRQKLQQQMVSITFVNYTSQEREVRIGDRQYIMRLNTTFHTMVPVGSVVSEYSNENSKIDGQVLLHVSASDADKSVRLR